MFKKLLLLFLFGCLGFYNAHAQNSARNCMHFGQADQYADCTSANRNITNQVTVEAWVKTGTLFNYQTLISKFTLNQGFFLFIQNGKAAFAGSTNSGTSVGSGFSITTVTDYHWHHLAGIYNSGQWQIWVDGILENNAAGSSNVTLTSTAPLIIGKSSPTSSGLFRGYLAEIRIWNTPRTGLQLQEYMCKLIETPPTTLTGYFTGDNGHPRVPSGDLYDRSLLALHGKTYYNKTIRNISVLGYPPVGNESVFLYGNNLQNQTFKINGELSDTLVINKINGQVKGVHLYRSDFLVAPTYHAPLAYVNYNFGVYTVGDTNATFQAKLTPDTIKCSASFYMLKRFESPLLFDKATRSAFKPIEDKITQVTDRYRGEYTFPFADPKPKPFYNGPALLCPGGSATLTATAPSGKYFYWSTGDTTKSIVVNNTGIYAVYISDRCAYIGYDTFRVEIAKPLPFSKLPVSDTLICPQNPLKIYLPANFTYKWPDGSSGNQHEISQPGQYVLEITEPVCQATAQYAFTVRVADCPNGAFIPNIITPNNDGLNDRFTITGLKLSDWELQIFSRWGKPVYESTNYKNDWNGNNVSGGIYYYYLRHKQTAKTYKGYVEVIK
jgi:gliding motility-associated-like protein